MSEIYTMDDVTLEEEVENAVNSALIHQIAAIRQQQIDNGPQEFVQPHIKLLQIAAEVGALRLQQNGLETLLAELAGDDEVFSDGWLSISSSIHALDSVFDQLYTLMKVYTDVIGSIGSTPELTQKLVDKSNEIVATESEENPVFQKLYEEFLSNSDINSDSTSEESNP